MSANRVPRLGLERLVCWSLVSAIFWGQNGCQPTSTQSTSTAPLPVHGDSNRPEPTDDQLRQTLDEMLDFTLRERQLTLTENAAWQILHGVLAYEHALPIHVGAGSPPVSAIAYLQSGGRMEGWELRPGEILDPTSGRKGLRALVEPGTLTGQGHVDQWLAILAQCGLQPTDSLQLAGVSYTLDDFLQQSMRDIGQNRDQEYSWTLISIVHYRPTDVTWKTPEGDVWNVERIVASEAQQDLGSSACGGTHRLSALAMALQRHQQQGRPVTGGWALAQQVVEQSVATVRGYQNPDGSLSSHYFQRGGQSADLADTIRTTGHTLEFLALALSDEDLRQPWVRKAVVRLCDAFKKTKRLPLECGALYHAARGLRLYRDRIYGERGFELPADNRTASL